MVVEYLCTRSELFRKLKMDTGVKILLLRPPAGFLEHFNKVLPYTTEWTDDQEDMNDHGPYRTIIVWPDDLPLLLDDIIEIMDHIEEEGMIWISTICLDQDLGREIEMSENIALSDDVLDITLDYSIVRLNMNKEDQNESNVV
jgi:hypothetical protein